MKSTNMIRGLAAAALALGASVAFAQSTGRSFTYTAGDAVDQDYSSAGNVNLSFRTTVNVNAYLYILGNLGADWTVDGWGVGQDERTESLFMYHNETLVFDFSNFGNLAKTAGTSTGSQSISLAARIKLMNDATSALLFDSGMLPAADLNTTFQPAGPSFAALDSDGKLKIEATRKITLDAGVGPGTYENVGTITVIRN